MVKVKTGKKTVTLKMIQDEWRGCTKCEIGKHVRNHVFMDSIPKGLTKADIVFIGEGPGVVEDVKGLPFTGPSGQLLRDAITEVDPECRHCAGSGYSKKRESDCPYCLGHGHVRIVLLNLLVCRPYKSKMSSPGNRQPAQQEVLNCMPRLVQMIQQINPSIFVMLGHEAQSYIPLIREELSKPMPVEQSGIEFMAMKHPANLLRQIGTDRTSLLYKQYTDQLQHCFDKYLNSNRQDSLQAEGARPGKPRARRA